MNFSRKTTLFNHLKGKNNFCVKLLIVDVHAAFCEPLAV